MKTLWMVAGAAAFAAAASSAQAGTLFIDTFDFTVAQSISIAPGNPGAPGSLGVDLVSPSFPPRTPPGSVVYFDIDSVTPSGEPAPIGGFRGLNVVSGTQATFISVLRRADIPGFDPASFPGTLGLQTGPFAPAVNFFAFIVWDAAGDGLDLDITDFATFRLDTFIVDEIGGQVDVTIRIVDNDGNESIQTQSGFTSTSSFFYDLDNFTADPDAGTTELADLTDVFSIAIEFETDLRAADITIDVASLQLIPEPLSMGLFGLGLALAGWAVRRRA